MGEDVDSVSEAALGLAEELSASDAVSETITDVEEGTPEIKVVLNRANAANYGITAYQLASALSGSLSGTTATSVTVDGDGYKRQAVFVLKLCH